MRVHGSHCDQRWDLTAIVEARSVNIEEAIRAELGDRKTLTLACIQRVEWDDQVRYRRMQVTRYCNRERQARPRYYGLMFRVSTHAHAHFFLHKTRRRADVHALPCRTPVSDCHTAWLPKKRNGPSTPMRPGYLRLFRPFFLDDSRLGMQFCGSRVDYLQTKRRSDR